MEEKGITTDRQIYKNHIRRLMAYQSKLIALVKRLKEWGEYLEADNQAAYRRLQQVLGEYNPKITQAREGEDFLFKLSGDRKIYIQKRFTGFDRDYEYGGLDVSVLDLTYYEQSALKKSYTSLLEQIALLQACPSSERELENCDFSSRDFKTLLDWWGLFDEEREKVTHLYKYRFDYEYRAQIEEQRRAARAAQKNQPKKIQKPTYLYLMKDNATGYYKIGYSSNPTVRESTLFSEKPSIELIQAWRATVNEEKELHDQFQEKRIRGEWFELEETDITFIQEKFSDRDTWE